MNRTGYDFYGADSAAGAGSSMSIDSTPRPAPIVLGYQGPAWVQPSNAEVAGLPGASTRPEPELYDLAIVVSGHAGLATTVYGASEGLLTAVIEREALGGHASTNSRIRNYLGSPRGISAANWPHTRTTRRGRC